MASGCSACGGPHEFDRVWRPPCQQVTVPVQEGCICIPKDEEAYLALKDKLRGRGVITAAMDDAFAAVLHDFSAQTFATLDRPFGPIYLTLEGNYFKVGCQKCGCQSEDVWLGDAAGKIRAAEVFERYTQVARGRVDDRRPAQQEFAEDPGRANRRPDGCTCCSSCPELRMPLVAGFELSWKIPQSQDGYICMAQSLFDKGVIDDELWKWVCRLAAPNARPIFATHGERGAPLFIVYHHPSKDTAASFLQVGCLGCRRQTDRIFYMAGTSGREYFKAVLRFVLRPLVASAGDRCGAPKPVAQSDAADGGVPSGWTRHEDAKGTPFFHHVAMKISVWKRPVEGWTPHWSQGRVFWYNVQARFSQWQEPLPSWQVFCSPDGHPYFHNNTTGVTQWENPAEALRKGGGDQEDGERLVNPDDPPKKEEDALSEAGTSTTAGSSSGSASRLRMPVVLVPPPPPTDLCVHYTFLRQVRLAQDSFFQDLEEALDTDTDDDGWSEA